MSKKQPRVPGTREITPNRKMRRHPEKLGSQDAPLARDDAGETPNEGAENLADGRDLKKTNVANQYR